MKYFKTLPREAQDHHRANNRKPEQQYQNTKITHQWGILRSGRQRHRSRPHRADPPEGRSVAARSSLSFSLSLSRSQAYIIIIIRWRIGYENNETDIKFNKRRDWRILLIKVNDTLPNATPETSLERNGRGSEGSAFKNTSGTVLKAAVYLFMHESVSNILPPPSPHIPHIR